MTPVVRTATRFARVQHRVPDAELDGFDIGQGLPADELVLVGPEGVAGQDTSPAHRRRFSEPYRRRPTPRCVDSRRR